MLRLISRIFLLLDIILVMRLTKRTLHEFLHQALASLSLRDTFTSVRTSRKLYVYFFYYIQIYRYFRDIIVFKVMKLVQITQANLSQPGCPLLKARRKDYLKSTFIRCNREYSMQITTRRLFHGLLLSFNINWQFYQ